jgi:hypothetical protein
VLAHSAGKRLVARGHAASSPAQRSALLLIEIEAIAAARAPQWPPPLAHEHLWVSRLTFASWPKVLTVHAGPTMLFADQDRVPRMATAGASQATAGRSEAYMSRARRTRSIGCGAPANTNRRECQCMSWPE